MKRPVRRHRSPAVAGPTLLAVLALAGCGEELAPRIQTLEESLAERISALEARIEAQRLAPNDIVHVELQGAGPNTRIAIVDPSLKRACKPAAFDCAGRVRWILSGHLPESWKVEVSEKNQASPTACFPDFELAQTQRVFAAEPAEGCRSTGVSWEYDVVLRDQNGDAKDRVDPRVVMTWAP